MKLYKISQNYLSILSHFENNDGEIGNDDIGLLRELDSLADDINNKAVNVAAYIKNIEAEYEQVSKARKDMQLREKRLEKKKEWLTDYLKLNLRRCGISEISSSPYFVIKVKNCPVSVNIIDESSIPSEYVKIKQEVVIDKVKLKKDMELGVVVDGAELQQNIRLEIK